nr:hypothetical protein [uncultured Cohaesibacter sp.]
MKINLSPQRRDDALTLSLAGDVLTVNGKALDFSEIEAGETMALDELDCEWLASDISRNEERELSLSLILPYGYIADPSSEAAQAVLYPEPIEVTEEGQITLPAC